MIAVIGGYFSSEFFRCLRVPSLSDGFGALCGEWRFTPCPGRKFRLLVLTLQVNIYDKYITKEFVLGTNL